MLSKEVAIEQTDYFIQEYDKKGINELLSEQQKLCCNTH